MPINFENPEALRSLSLVEVYNQLAQLRGDPEEFEKAADAFKQAYFSQMSEDDRAKMEKLQSRIDAVVKKAGFGIEFKQ